LLLRLAVDRRSSGREFGHALIAEVQVYAVLGRRSWLPVLVTETDPDMAGQRTSSQEFSLREENRQETGAILMSLFRRGDVWWYEFWFAGRRIQESSKSISKTVAKSAELRRRRELAEGYNSFEDIRHERVRTINEIATDFLTSYKLRNPQSAVFATYAVRHLQRVIGDRMLVEVSEQTVRDYQDQRRAKKPR
jgi:hypothetical protein